MFTVAPVNFCGVGGASTRGEITIKEYSKLRRSMHVILTGFLGLLVTIAALFVPLAHFVLVPLAVVSTLLLIRFVAKRGKASILSGRGTCPYCTAQITFGWRPLLGKSFEERCFKCQRAVRVGLKS